MGRHEQLTFKTIAANHELYAVDIIVLAIDGVASGKQTTSYPVNSAARGECYRVPILKQQSFLSFQSCRVNFVHYQWRAACCAVMWKEDPT